MELRNNTGFSAAFFRQLNLIGALNGVVAVRGTFDLLPRQVMAPSEAQEPFQWSDFYAADPHRSHLLKPADFVPYKPGTDVTILATSYAPNRRPAASWVCGVRIGTRLTKTLRVCGSRFWEACEQPGGWQRRSAFAGWCLTQPEPALSVPISWNLAFGGRPVLAGPTDPAPPPAHPFNSLGPGLLDAERTPRDRLIPAPQIEATDDPITDWRQEYLPQGFAPVPPWWRFRQRYVGTVDERWVAERHPLLPTDFDYKFYQTAHPDLVIEPWLDGNETIELARLDPNHDMLVTHLPAIRPVATIRFPRQPPVALPLPLDGVHIDLCAAPNRVCLTWRAGFGCPVDAGSIDLDIVDSMAAAA